MVPEGYAQALAAALAPDVGALVGPYRLAALLGSGGMGWVYRAHHVGDDRVAAVKILRAEQLMNERSAARMVREARILATVSHPGIPKFFDCGLLADHRPWIAMELIAGPSLTTRYQGPPIPPDEIIATISEVAGVLAAAHAHEIVHRDIKPDNIVLSPDGVHVVDWGIARHRDGARYTNADEVIGTPTYMAPEHARGVHCDDPLSDIYGLGVIAYQGLARRAPFLGSGPVEILVQHINDPVPALAPRCPYVPMGVIELVERMLEKRPEHRPSALEVKERLDRFRRRAT